MNVLSLFGGIECGYNSFLNNNIKIDNYYSCEIDKYASAISRYNINNIIELGDVSKVDFSSLKDIDIVIGGSPCTYWSIAKKNREVTNEGIGYELFMQYVRVLKETNPKYFIYENNHSIHDDIKQSISKELGVDYIMINSSLVSAQNRKRCYWTNIPEICQPEDKKIVVKDILDPFVDLKYYISPEEVESKFKYSIRNTSLLDVKYNDASVRLGNFNKGGQGDRVYWEYGKSITLSANGGGRGAKTGLYMIDKSIRRLTPVEAENYKRYLIIGPNMVLMNLVKLYQFLMHKYINVLVMVGHLMLSHIY